jgi:hypothetical protein
MYQPYPASEPPQEPPRIQPPGSVRTAVKLMYVGAALSAIVVIVTLVTVGSLKSGILARHPDYTAAQRHTAEVAAVTIALLGGLIAIGLWLWMAWANGRGRNWARAVSAVFFGINTLDLIISVSQVHATAALIVSVLAGLGAIVLIFNKQSSPFYKQQPAQL